MSALLKRAMAVRIGGPDAKLALICLCAQAGDADCKATITYDMAEDAFKATELTRKVFTESLKILRQHRLIGVNTGKDLAGERVLVSIDIDLSAPAPNNPDVQISDGSIQSIVWDEGLKLFRRLGKPEATARPLIGRLIKSAKGDLFKLRDAIVSADRARPSDPFTYIQGILTKGTNDGEGVSATFERRARGIGTADDRADCSPP